jgi:outer membrane lipoprotein-sorting protein
MRTRFVPLGLAFCCIAFCQDKPDAAALVAKVRANYAKATRFHFIGTETATGQKPKDVEFAGELPGKARFEGSIAGVRPSVVIVDGENYFAYSKESKNFVEGKDAKEAGLFLQLARGLIDSIQAGDADEKATVLRGEALTAIDCWVVQITDSDFVRTWWIDKQASIVWREDVVRVREPRSSKESLVFRVASIDEPVSADLFRFSPPAGAKKVATLAELGLK